MFIVLEGVDCAGKTTVINKLKFELNNLCNYKIVTTSDPKGTDFGKKIMKIILDKNNSINRFSEMFLFLSMRMELIFKVIKPNLDKKNLVICDRFILSTLVYQLPDFTKYWEEFILLYKKYLLLPDYTFIIDIKFNTFKKRLLSRKKRDKFESIEYKKFNNLRQKYLLTKDILTKLNKKCFIINGEIGCDYICKSIIQIINNKKA